MIRYLFYSLLLIAAFALTTFGLMQWQAQGFAVDGIWPFRAPFGELFRASPQLHPIHYLALGVIMIPLSLWKIFLLEPGDSDHAP